MGKQSARMIYNAQDHKDIGYNGEFHSQIYVTDNNANPELVWEKYGGEPTLPSFSFKVQDTTINGKTGEVVSAGHAFIYVEKIEGKELVIDWGDGLQTVVPSYEFTSNVEYEHAYPTSNGTIYTVTLCGGFGGFMGCCENNGHLRNNYSCIVELLSPIYPQMLRQYDNGIYSAHNMFKYVRTLTKVCSNLLRRLRNIGTIEFAAMFENTSISDIPVRFFEGIKSGYLGKVFSGTNIETIQPGTFCGIDAMGNTHPYYGCSKLKYVYDAPVNIGNMSGAFSFNKVLEVFDTEIHGGTNFNCCFQGASNLRIISSRIFTNSPDATNFGSCFEGCTSLVSGVDEYMFDNNVGALNLFRTFYSCSSVTGMLPALWERDNIADNTLCFYNCANATNYNEVPDSWKS